MRTWTEEEIKDLVQTNDKVLYGALKALYGEQTADEQMAGDTNAQNERGFNKIDAEFLTSVSKFLLSRGYLTDKQKIAVRKKLVKYNKQITKLANEQKPMEQESMKTVDVFVDLFQKKTGPNGTFTIVNLTLDAVKTVLNHQKLDLKTEGAQEDLKAGFLYRDNKSGFYRNFDGYVPTVKGYKAILAALQ